MKKNLLRGIVWLLVLAMMLSQLLLPPAPEVQAASPRTIQEGVTLHCWNWSFANIEANMAKIASLGYTAIQTSPIQQAKQRTSGYQTYDWWVYYQPMGFHIDNSGNSALGTKAQFESMCRTAHKYGIKVIVDVVANHLGDNGSNKKSPAIIDDIENDPSCWHDISKTVYDYNKRYDVTQWCLDGLPDLNTGSQKIQNYVLGYLKECIDAGADGFRFDAAKHIETPDDGWDNCSSNFWPTVINGAVSYAKSRRNIDLYCYGELLDHPGGSLGVGSYTKYMSITDNTWGNTLRDKVVSDRNAGAFSYSYHKDASANQLVLWAESHDTYAANQSSYASTEIINKTWALAAARADAMSLYLARPNGYTQPLGTASVTGWANSEVGAVNKFHNAFVGQGEYVSNENGIAYVERGNSGVVLVNCGGTSANVNVSAHTMKNGTYVDQVTGSRFTVSNGRIQGRIGATGVAVVYNMETCTHTSHNLQGLCTNCYTQVGHSYVDGKCACGAAEQVIYFANTANWSQVNIYSWDENGALTDTWPGSAMKKVSDNLYSYTLPTDAVNVIFNNGSTQTKDLTIPTGRNLYTYATGTWSVYTPNTNVCIHPGYDQDGCCVKCGEALSTEILGVPCGYPSDGDPKTYTLYARVPNTWTSAYAYTWGGESQEYYGTWPGTAMEKEGDWYRLTLKAGTVNLIINQNGQSQTKDLTILPNRDVYVTVTDTNAAEIRYSESLAEAGHAFTQYKSDGNATCTADGTKTATCTRCTKTHTLPDPGTMAHSYENGKCTFCGASELALGDVNGDGKINMKDWSALYDHVNEITALTGDALTRADVNGDGKVNLKDWSRLYEHVNEIDPL